LADRHPQETAEVISLLGTDANAGLALGVEPPHHPQKNLLGRGLGRHVLWVGLLMGPVSLVLSTVVFWSVEMEKQLMRWRGVRS